MDVPILVTTLVVLPLPVILAVVGLRAPAPASTPLLAAATLSAVLYAGIWLFMRPSAFELDRSTLRLVWPLRSREIDLRGARVKIYDNRGLRERIGWGMRIGAGGLWGGFGWLWTREGLMGLWISRVSPIVLLEPRNERPMLLTPENPEAFVELVSRAA